jgi:hypothetical protein
MSEGEGWDTPRCAGAGVFCGKGKVEERLAARVRLVKWLQS